MKFPSVAGEFGKCVFFFQAALHLNSDILFLDTKILKEIYLKCLVDFFVVAGSEPSFLLSCFDQAVTE